MKYGIKLGSIEYDIHQKLTDLYGPTVAEDVLGKTGPKLLYHCDDTENSLSLGMKAVEDLIENNEVDLFSVSNVIFVTETPFYLFPGNSAFLISKFKFNKNVSCVDLNAGCTGFPDALKIALSVGGSSLIVCSETYSKHIVNFNRATSSLFSDGACAIYVEKNNWNLIKSYALTSPMTYDHISVFGYGSNLKMDGKEVYNFVASEIVAQLIEILEANSKVDRTYLHQGSKLVVEYLSKKLKRFDTSLPSNIEIVGNVVSATLPILMRQDNMERTIKNGERILVAGFGVGLYFSACILEKT